MASRTKRLASEGIRRLAENWGLRGSFGPLYDPGIYASGSDFNPYEGYAPRQQALESRRGEELNRGTGSGATFSGNDYYDRTSTWTSDYPDPDQVENTASLLGRGSEERLAKPAVTGHDLRTSKSPFTLPINHSPPRDAPGGLRFWLIMVSLMATTILSALDLVSAFAAPVLISPTHTCTLSSRTSYHVDGSVYRVTCHCRETSWVRFRE